MSRHYIIASALLLLAGVILLYRGDFVLGGFVYTWGLIVISREKILDAIKGEDKPLIGVVGTDSMLFRIAKVLNDSDDSFEMTDDDIQKARDIIKAMREPTDKMLDNVSNWSDDHYGIHYIAYGPLASHYRSMMDAALGIKIDGLAPRAPKKGIN